MRRRSESGFPYRTQVLERSFAILDILAESGNLTLADMEDKLRLHKSTLYRLLRILERHRFAEKDLATGKYRLGSRLLELGTRAANRIDLAIIARPYLEKLSRESGETAHLGALLDGEVISIGTADGQHALRMSVTVGGKSPAHCSSLGKTILAFLPEKEVDTIVRKHGLKAFTQRTITQRSQLRAEFAQIQERGFAVDDQELEDGLKCIGAPVRDHSGKVIAALSIAGAAVRLGPKRVPALASIVAQVASDLSAGLGYRPGSLISPDKEPRFASRRTDSKQRC